MEIAIDVDVNRGMISILEIDLISMLMKIINVDVFSIFFVQS